MFAIEEKKEVVGGGWWVVAPHTAWLGTWEFARE